MRVHNTGNSAVVNVAVSLANVLDSGDTLLLGLVRQHSTEGNITDHTDMRDLCAVLLVNDDTAALVGLNTDVLEAKAGSVGSATDGDEDDVSVKLGGLA